MGYFPFFMDLEGREGLVVGGGAVALRKLQKLLPYGPRLTVAAPELLADIFTDGIYLTGGSANLYGLSTLLSKKTRIPVAVGEEPENCVVNGAGRAVKFIDKMDRTDHGKINPLMAYN